MMISIQRATMSKLVMDRSLVELSLWTSYFFNTLQVTDPLKIVLIPKQLEYFL